MSKDYAKILKELQINHTELAEMLSVNVRSVRRWFNGYQKMPEAVKHTLVAWQRLNSIAMPWRPGEIDLGLREKDMPVVREIVRKNLKVI